MTESQPPLTRRELRELRARREAELQNRAASAADEAPGQGPGASPRVPDEGSSQAARRQRRPADPAPGTLFLPRTAPTPPAPARSDAAQASAPQAPAVPPTPAARPAEATERPEPAAGVAQPTAPQGREAHTSRRKERLRRQAEQARLAVDSEAPDADQSDDTFIPGAAARPTGAEATPSAPVRPSTPAPSREAAAEAASRTAAPRPTPTTPARPAPSAPGSPRPSAPTSGSAPANPATPRPSAPSNGPAPTASPTAEKPTPANAAPAEQAAAGEDHASHRRRRTGGQHHSPELQAALGASPTLEAAQAEIEAMAAAREAALRRALARRHTSPPEESFSSALGLPTTGSAVPHVPRTPGATQPEPARPPRSARRPGEREAQFPAPGTPTGPVPWQRPAASTPGPSAGVSGAPTDAGAAPTDAAPATSFSDLLGLPSAPPAKERPRKGGRRAQPAQVEDRAAQKRLENTGLISPVTQEVSVVVPQQSTTAAAARARAEAEAEAADSTGPIAASSAHGLDPLEYKSAGVQRSRWGLVVVLASVLVAVTAVVWALTA
ncbi:MAG: hypothetical protein LBE25_08000 [Arthrobacter sp.]|jgi:hypothetical protein|nr:hypothetical protein [Arthrobacter sp.]